MNDNLTICNFTGVERYGSYYSGSIFWREHIMCRRDDVSSALDASTELELWAALRERGTTVIGATSKRAALAQADRVVVLVDGTVAASGRWAELAPAWQHLAG